MTCTMALLILVVIFTMQFFSARGLLRDHRQRKAEEIRAGILVGERCTYCGQLGQPVEMDWRAPIGEERWVCQDARACVGRGRVGG